MSKKLTSLLLAFVMIFALAGCKEKNDEQTATSTTTKTENEPQEAQDPVVTQALALVEKGDIEGAYDLLYNLKERNTEQKIMFMRFAYYIVESHKKYGADSSSIINTFNEDGYVLSSFATREGEDAGWEKYTYTYDENNNMLACQYDSSEKGSFKYSFTYNQNNKLLTASYNGNTTETFTYHNNGNIASYSYKNSYQYYIDDIYPILQEETFDEDGRKLTFYKKFSDGTWTKSEYTYNKNSSVHKIISDDGYWREESYTYDDNDNILSKNITNSKGEWEQEIYTYDKNEKVLTEKRSNSHSDVSVQYEYAYDNNGNMLSKYTTFSNGDWRKEEKSYNNDGNITKVKITDSDGNSSQTIYTYDTNGKTASYVDETSRHDWVYDNNGNLLLEKTSYPNGNYESKTYVYNADGNILSCESSSSEDGTTKETYTYNQDGKVIKYIKTNNNGNVTTEQNYTYDENGNKKTLDPWNKGSYIIEDKHGNQIEEYIPGGKDYDNAWGLDIEHKEQKSTSTYKLCYFPNGAPTNLPSYFSPDSSRSINFVRFAS